jgi:AbrB family looped-hinge helix DNA binding protein
MQTTTLTSKGQVTIPRDVRQHFGLTQGMAMTFEIEGDHISLRPTRAQRQAQDSGFGLIKSRRKGVPADFDVASLATEAP